MKFKSFLLQLIAIGVYFLFTCQPIWADPLTFDQAYKILGVDPTASQAQIKKAYQKLAMKYHPDRNKAPNAEAMFKQSQEAYELLRDKKKKNSEANNQAYGRYSDIVSLYRLGYFDFYENIKKIPTEDVLIDIYNRHNRVQFLISTYLAGQHNGQMSEKSLLQSLENILAQLNSIRNSEKFPRVKTAQMVAVISARLSNQYSPDLVDQFLSEYVQTIQSTLELKSFIVDSNIFQNNAPSANPLDKNWVDPVKLYPRTLSQIFLTPTRELLDSFIYRELLNEIFNPKVFENSFEFLTSLVKKANDPKLWDIVAARLAIRDVKSSNAKLNLNEATINFLTEGMTKGIRDETKIAIYFSMAKINPQLLIQHSQLYSELLNVSDYSTLEKAGDGFFKITLKELILNSSGEAYQKFVYHFVNRLIERDPQLVQKILSGNIAEIEANIQSLIQSFGPQNVSKEYLDKLRLQKRTLEHYTQLAESTKVISCEKLFSR